MTPVREVCDCPAGKRVAAYLASKREPAFGRMANDPYVWVSPATSEPFVWSDPHPLGTASLAGDDMELRPHPVAHFETTGTPIKRRIPFVILPPPTADLTWPPVLIVAALVFGPWIIGAALS